MPRFLRGIRYFYHEGHKEIHKGHKAHVVSFVFSFYLISKPFVIFLIGNICKRSAPAFRFGGS